MKLSSKQEKGITNAIADKIRFHNPFINASSMTNESHSLPELQIKSLSTESKPKLLCNWKEIGMVDDYEIQKYIEAFLKCILQREYMPLNINIYAQLNSAIITVNCEIEQNELISKFYCEGIFSKIPDFYIFKIVENTLIEIPQYFPLYNYGINNAPFHNQQMINPYYFGFGIIRNSYSLSIPTANSIPFLDIKNKKIKEKGNGAKTAKFNIKSKEIEKEKKTKISNLQNNDEVNIKKTSHLDKEVCKYAKISDKLGVEGFSKGMFLNKINDFSYFFEIGQNENKREYFFNTKFLTWQFNDFNSQFNFCDEKTLYGLLYELKSLIKNKQLEFNLQKFKDFESQIFFRGLTFKNKILTHNSLKLQILARAICNLESIDHSIPLNLIEIESLASRREQISIELNKSKLIDKQIKELEHEISSIEKKMFCENNPTESEIEKIQRLYNKQLKKTENEYQKYKNRLDRSINDLILTQTLNKVSLSFDEEEEYLLLIHNSFLEQINCLMHLKRLVIRKKMKQEIFMLEKLPMKYEDLRKLELIQHQADFLLKKLIAQEEIEVITFQDENSIELTKGFITTTYSSYFLTKREINRLDIELSNTKNNKTNIINGRINNLIAKIYENVGGEFKNNNLQKNHINCKPPLACYYIDAVRASVEYVLRQLDLNIPADISMKDSLIDNLIQLKYLHSTSKEYHELSLRKIVDEVKNQYIPFMATYNNDLKEYDKKISTTNTTLNKYEHDKQIYKSEILSAEVKICNLFKSRIDSLIHVSLLEKKKRIKF